jgi:hypothetical protein
MTRIQIINQVMVMEKDGNDDNCANKTQDMNYIT